MIDTLIFEYRNGYDINAIAYDLDKTDKEIKAIIKTIVSSHVEGDVISDWLRELIFDRYKSGIRHSCINRELGFGKGYIRRFLERNGFDVDISRPSKEKSYKVIEHTNITECPDCGRADYVNEVSDPEWAFSLDESNTRTTSHHKKKNKNYYCKSCFTEWYKVGKQVRKVMFENL